MVVLGEILRQTGVYPKILEEGGNTNRHHYDGVLAQLSRTEEPSDKDDGQCEDDG